MVQMLQIDDRVKQFRFDFEEDAFAPLAADPRVQAELARLEQEESEARDAIVQYLVNRN